MPVPEILQRVRTVRHSRVPVFSEHRDNLVGFVRAEDVLRLVLDKMDLRLLNVEDIVHPPVVVPPTKKVDEMFDFFQKRQCRAAVVLNEFGGVDGFVTITDVLNFIFSQIAGQVKGEEMHRDRDLDARLPISALNDLLGLSLPTTEFHTAAGLIIARLRHLPEAGDEIVESGFCFRVEELKGPMITRIIVERDRPQESKPRAKRWRNRDKE